MFVLAEMQDVIRIEPHQFKFDMQRQIADELNKKLANKVDAPLPSHALGQGSWLVCAWLECDSVIAVFCDIL